MLYIYTLSNEELFYHIPKNKIEFKIITNNGLCLFYKFHNIVSLDRNQSNNLFETSRERNRYSCHVNNEFKAEFSSEIIPNHEVFKYNHS